MLALILWSSIWHLRLTMGLESSQLSYNHTFVQLGLSTQLRHCGLQFQTHSTADGKAFMWEIHQSNVFQSVPHSFSWDTELLEWGCRTAFQVRSSTKEHTLMLPAHQWPKSKHYVKAKVAALYNIFYKNILSPLFLPSLFQQNVCLTCVGSKRGHTCTWNYRDTQTKDI